jgi:uncharacterized membrane protein
MATVKGPVLQVNRTAARRRGLLMVWIPSLLVSILLPLLGFVVPFDGKPHHDWQQFFGRFHPLVVHLPIGLLLLVPVLEIVGQRRAALREAAHFVLSLSFFACLLSVVLGFLLAYGGGSAGAGVVRHMWGGIALTIAVLACALFCRRPAYPWLLAGVLLLLLWTAHQGGSLTHGDNYLTEYLPRPLKVMFAPRGKAEAPQFPDSFYARHIYPMLDKKCVSCHGEEEVKGHLRLDSYDLLMRGGSDGAVVIPGHPERSILLQRVTLPPTDKKFMPAENKPPLTPDEINWIRAWIAQGASPELKTLAGITVYEPEPPPPPVPDYSALLPRISQVAKADGVTLVPVSRNLGDGLILNTTDAGSKFGDTQLAALSEFAPYIVEVNLARTSVTDACLATLAKFANLRAIHLDGTAINGSSLVQLTHLQQLRYLNLSETQVTQAAVAPLSSMKNLSHLYVFDTPAQRKQP